MTEMDLQDQVLILLRRIIRATYLHSRKLEKKTGLTTPQLMALRTIDDLKEPTVSDIAKSVSLSLATVTTLLNRLEKQGMVHRERSTIDRRRVIVTLTEVGQKKLDAAPKPLQDSFNDRFSDIEAWEQHLIMAALERIATMMDAEDLDASPLLTEGDEVL
ncbi:transcriptional regulator, MarR family [Luminiphilus syltensis NOR5-1B]|uniref:Transcriptional regulator, MarR family n=1 Tax=Luminiphilus syltensis NOR5-1B TaxID=565045 RepID=B8KTL6_9GAMM|nr:MarR family transcriptional regulator [Luminiphilus syltensis]EED36853.1 transcriptional regulator, MarR family [Luminiphilus syltensis NOR5-1B]